MGLLGHQGDDLQVKHDQQKPQGPRGGNFHCDSHVDWEPDERSHGMDIISAAAQSSGATAHFTR
eukprot:2202535-Pyramimonas_sp.AAC.1